MKRAEKGLNSSARHAAGPRKMAPAGDTPPRRPPQPRPTNPGQRARPRQTPPQGGHIPIGRGFYVFRFDGRRWALASSEDGGCVYYGDGMRLRRFQCALFRDLNDAFFSSRRSQEFGDSRYDSYWVGRRLFEKLPAPQTRQRHAGGTHGEEKRLNVTLHPLRNKRRHHKHNEKDRLERELLKRRRGASAAPMSSPPSRTRPKEPQADVPRTYPRLGQR
ncbi:hypothetical protein Tneu_1705 [Pyrobaculum neutrophilum V24Sta]|uniref:Uncharacterized protein n=1 Tax=Pyrobaculum neutrophilum (strain DSM 2338 / JCM 9278 / NBRC 100436 / V24Sta) TaxID=444157 RepID=B1YAH6_PYRNV|nr:hypothetical protein Tneu_1705 [Pyrobaculum neutrophilum V24Sta]